MLADVPQIFCSKSPILTFYKLRSILSFLLRSKAIMHVIILVKEAIYKAVLLFKETIT